MALSLASYFYYGHDNSPTGREFCMAKVKKIKLKKNKVLKIKFLK
jgi:hypothetical protein